MSDNRQDSTVGSSDIYNDLSTEDLRELISYAFYEENVDLDTLDKMMDIYSKRDGVPTVDATAAWENFQKYYMGHEETFPLPPGYAENANQTIDIARYGKTRKHKGLIRFSASAAALIILFLLVDTIALGNSVWRSFMEMGRETLEFITQKSSLQRNSELTSLHAKLEDYGIVERLAPNWIPAGFELVDLSDFDMPTQITINSYYEKGAESLSIQIIAFVDKESVLYEKTGNEVTVYKRNGIEHHFLENEGKMSIVWVRENYECHIVGDITTIDAKRMINSIYER